MISIYLSSGCIDFLSNWAIDLTHSLMSSLKCLVPRLTKWGCHILWGFVQGEHIMTDMTTLAGKDLIGTIGKMLMQDMDVGKLIDWIDNSHDNAMD